MDMTIAEFCDKQGFDQGYLVRGRWINNNE